MDFNAIYDTESVDNSRNKATMVGEFNGGVENGNWSDKDIIIVYVHFLELFSHIYIYSVAGWSVQQPLGRVLYVFLMLFMIRLSF